MKVPYEDFKELEDGTEIASVIKGVFDPVSIFCRAGVGSYIFQDHINGSRSGHNHSRKYSWSLGTATNMSSLKGTRLAIFPKGTTKEEAEEALGYSLHLAPPLKISDREHFVDNVLEYFDRNSTDPLIWRRGGGEITIENYQQSNTDKLFTYAHKNRSEVEQTIILIERICKNYSSTNLVSGEVETSSDRSRSSGDIWRHYLRYDPNITIFQVLTAMWNILDDAGTYAYGCSWCSTVKKFVTYPSPSKISNRDKATIDEYGNLLHLWKEAEQLYEEYLKKESNVSV